MTDVISLISLRFELSLMAPLKTTLYSISNADYFPAIFFIDAPEFNC